VPSAGEHFENQINSFVEVNLAYDMRIGAELSKLGIQLQGDGP
jgi:hypothetical protein